MQYSFSFAHCHPALCCLQWVSGDGQHSWHPMESILCLVATATARKYHVGVLFHKHNIFYSFDAAVLYGAISDGCQVMVDTHTPYNGANTVHKSSSKGKNNEMPHGGVFLAFPCFCSGTLHQLQWLPGVGVGGWPGDSQPLVLIRASIVHGGSKSKEMPCRGSFFQKGLCFKQRERSCYSQILTSLRQPPHQGIY